MKTNNLIFYFTLLLFFSCKSFQDKKSESSLNVIQNTSTLNIEEIINCEENDFDSIRQNYLDTIKSIQNDIVAYVAQSKLDSIKKDGVINSLKQNDTIFNKYYSSEAELIYWAYGSASMTGERLVSSNCYYLYLLNNRIALLKYVRRKLLGSIITE